MTHDEAFLADIAEHPADDAPRLIYADWLEEHGGPAEAARAAFIRGQCRLARMLFEDPTRPALEDECSDLLAEHEQEWTAPVRGVAERWEFQRGFIERIEVSDDVFVEHANRLVQCLPLRAVAFQLREKSSKALADCVHVAQLETIDVRHQGLGDRALQPLLTSPHLKRLTALNLSGNAIGAATAEALLQGSFAPRLRWLDLGRNEKLGDGAVATLVNSSRLARLEALRLGWTNITATGLQEVFATRSLRRLAVLHLGSRDGYYGGPIAFRFLHSREARFGNPRGGENEGVSAAVLEKLAQSSLPPRLLSLDLSGWVRARAWTGLLSLLQRMRLSALYLQQCGLSETETRLLARLPQLSSLTTLDLSMNRLGAKDFLPLAESPHLANLIALDLGFNSLRAEGATMLASAPHLRRLTLLNLRTCFIGEAGMTALARSPNLQSLRWLNLAANPINNAASIKALASSSHLRRLTMLDLGNCWIWPDSAQALAQRSQLGRLEQLFVDGNHFGDQGAALLAASPTLGRLKLLDLRDNNLGLAGAEALAASHQLGRLRHLDVRQNDLGDHEAQLLRKRFGAAVKVDGNG